MANCIKTLKAKSWWSLLLVVLFTLIGTTKIHAWPAANLTIARQGHSATLLQDGRVLVIGGWDHLPNEPITDTTVVEIYNPLTNSWSLAASLPVGRSHHTATLLPDGRVLIAGGSTGGEIQASANLYDPVINTWSNAADLNVARALHTATLLNDGRVLVNGGVGGNDDTIINSAEIYDPYTDNWSDVADMVSPRADHSATLLPNGHVVVIGVNEGESAFSSIEIYDPIIDSWRQGESLAEIRDGHTATLLPDGRILVVGGIKNGEISATAALYDPIANNWASAASLSEARRYHSATLLPDGTLLVAGGEDNGDFPDTIEQYDPGLDVWTTVASLAEPRADQTMTLLPDGRVLIAGGYDPDFYPVSIWGVEIINPFLSSWLPAASPNVPRSFHTTTMLPNGRLLVAGGGDFNGYLTSAVELYDPEADSWSTAPSLSTDRAEHTATMLPNNSVVIIGGRDSAGALASIELYNPSENSWVTSASLPTARYRHTATLLQNGRVLIAGGVDGMYNSTTPMASAALYNPVTNAWTAMPNLNTVRYWHTATQLPDGRVFVAGGRGLTGRPINSTEIYDPIANSWTSSANLTTASSGHTATLLPDGKILVVGGRSGNLRATPRVEIYDPVINTWRSVTSLTTARYGHTATLLANGQVLVVGGYDDYDVLSNAELYDPATDSWMRVSNPNTQPFDHTATLLPSGQILLVGGRDGNAIASAERYDPGLDFDEAWRPKIETINSPLLLGTSLNITGQQFRGISGASGGGSFNDAATDYPLVQLRSLANDQVMWLHPDADMGWSRERFISTAVTDFPIGPAFVTLFANAIPSQSVMIQVANEEQTLTVGADGGSVTSLPEGIDCGIDCSEAYAYGTVVTLTTTAETGFTFTGWSGACGGTGDCVVTLDQDKSVTANFILDNHMLTVSLGGSGSGYVTSAPGGINCGTDCREMYDYGTVITLTAVADMGNTFAGWRGACDGENDCIVTMSEAKDVSATFVKYFIFLPAITTDP